MGDQLRKTLRSWPSSLVHGFTGEGEKDGFKRAHVQFVSGTTRVRCDNLFLKMEIVKFQINAHMMKKFELLIDLTIDF